MSWNNGYITEIEYNHNYFGDLAPSTLRLALMNRGYDPFPNRPLRYLELGFGQGLSLAVHAAATDGEYWGTDFNPTQAANAQELAASFPGNIKVLNDSFEEFLARKDLPSFDVIALHGIWSWISSENRRIIVEIVRRTLTIGGVLYISYNCTPGWSAAMPIRHLMTLHERYASRKDGPLERRVEDALAFSKKVAESGAIYFRENKHAADRLDYLSKMNRRYLAHEYFNSNWDPMPFTDVAAMFEEAKMSFAASGNLMDHLDVVNLGAEAQKTLSNIAHVILRESVRDFFVNTQFRKDIYIKGPRPLAKTAIEDRFRTKRFVLMRTPEKIPLKIRGALGEASLEPVLYKAVIDALAENDLAGCTLGKLETVPQLSAFGFKRILEAAFVLCAAGHAHPAQEDDEIQRALPKTQALNRHLVERSRYNGEITVLSSPVIGGGVTVGRFEQLFLGSYQRGLASPEQWATEAWDTLKKEGQRLIKDGKALDTPQENQAELLEKATAFARDELPVLKALLVADSA